MVEKIIINPTKVRAYGNIINQHSTTDYTNYACTLTETTDTINGQTVPAYEMEDTILFWDKAITGMKNTNWLNYSNRFSPVTDENGTTLSKASSNGYYLVSINNEQFLFEDYIVEFDVVSCTNQAVWYMQGSNTSFQDVFNIATRFSSGGHCKIVCKDGVIKVYKDGTQAGVDITVTPTPPFEIGFRINSHPTDERNIKYKNFILYE